MVADALKLHDWWQEQGYATKYKKPLLICVNNTLNIMPHELRGSVIDQMIAVAGKEGLCMVSYWNGTLRLLHTAAWTPNINFCFATENFIRNKMIQFCIFCI